MKKQSTVILLSVLVTASLLVAPNSAIKLTSDHSSLKATGYFLRIRKLLQFGGGGNATSVFPPEPSGDLPGVRNPPIESPFGTRPTPSAYDDLRRDSQGNPAPVPQPARDDFVFPGGQGQPGGQQPSDTPQTTGSPATPVASPGAEVTSSPGSEVTSSPTAGSAEVTSSPDAEVTSSPGTEVSPEPGQSSDATSTTESPSPSPLTGPDAQPAGANTTVANQAGQAGPGGIPPGLGGDIGSIVNDAISSSRADAAASAITQAGSGGNAAAAADSIIQQSAAGRTDTIADAIVQAVASNTAATAAVLAQAASRARVQGNVDSFAQSQAQAFVRARGAGKVSAFTDTVAQTISSGGDDATQAYGAAFARAAAGSGDEQEALAEATATAFCQGGSQARAFASAYAVALSRDEKSGCLVLSRARALAVAQCQGGEVQVYAEAEAESRVIGFCKRRYPDLPGFVNFLVNNNFNYGLGNLLSGIGRK